MNNLQSIMLQSELTELIFMTGARNGLSENQRERFREIWNMLSDSGKEHFQILAEEMSRELPEFCN